MQTREMIDLRRQFVAASEKMTSTNVRCAKLENEMEKLKKEIADLKKPIEEIEARLEKKLLSSALDRMKESLKEEAKSKKEGGDGK